MNFDLLLRWLSYKKEGSWMSFRMAVQNLAGLSKGSKLDYLSRLRFSNLAHVDFFDTFEAGVRVQRWWIKPPILAGLANEQEAMLCGFRNEVLVERLIAASEACDCVLSIANFKHAPTEYRLTGNKEKFEILAELAGVQYVHQYSLQQLDLIQPIAHCENLPLIDSPKNWQISSFSFTKLAWLLGNADDAVVEFQSKFAPHLRISMLKVGSKFVALDRYTAIYAGAERRGFQLASYDSDSDTITCPPIARLPDSFERIATMASGKIPQVRGEARVYEGIPAHVARPLLVALGQRCEHPIEIITSIGRSRTGE